MRSLAPCLAGLALLAALGCRSVGVRTIERDRLAYSQALSQSIKTQALLNLVKLRYLDAPVFLDVGQIVSSDSLETSLSMEGVYTMFGAHAWDNATLNAGGKYTSRPTVTFSPMTGDKFMRAMIEPIAAVRILSLIESGYDARFALETCVSAINGLQNRSAAAGHICPADEDFDRLMNAISQVQALGGMGFRIERSGKEEPACVLLFRRPRQNPEVESAAREVKALLGLNVEDERFVVVHGNTAGAPGQLTIQTRSMMQVLAALASYIDVPQEHIASGRVLASPPVPATGTLLLRVHCGTRSPKDVFCAVRFRDHWFWVDDRDLPSKRTISFVNFLFTLAGSGNEVSLPVLTIPAGG
jgi:hypothetical protein